MGVSVVGKLIATKHRRRPLPDPALVHQATITTVAASATSKASAAAIFVDAAQNVANTAETFADFGEQRCDGHVVRQAPAKGSPTRL
jgi:hypothetical protein